jgi:hypothetical protein
MCKAYLAALVEHLEPFMTYMNEQFAPVETKLATLRECGQLEFDVLVYHFEPGMKLVRFSCSDNHPDAFVLTNCSLERAWFGDEVVRLSGYAYKFDGDEYERRSVRTDIEKFEGTKPMQSLSAIELTAQIEEALKSTSVVLYSSTLHLCSFRTRRAVHDSGGCLLQGVRG